LNSDDLLRTYLASRLSLSSGGNTVTLAARVASAWSKPNLHINPPAAAKRKDMSDKGDETESAGSKVGDGDAVAAGTAAAVAPAPKKAKQGPSTSPGKISAKAAGEKKEGSGSATKSAGSGGDVSELREVENKGEKKDEKKGVAKGEKKEGTRGAKRQKGNLMVLDGMDKNMILFMAEVGFFPFRHLINL
jgi:hypothetical protein